MAWQKFISIVKHSLNYNPYLDGLRGVSTLLVVLFHVWNKKKLDFGIDKRGQYPINLSLINIIYY
jgi:peptidoglycan/LPS O-acetylase OafA/YrhL